MNIKSISSRTRIVLLVAAGLLVASTATAGAAQLITGQSVKNESLTGRDVRNGSLKGADIQDASLTKDDFSGTLAGPQGPGTPGTAGSRRAAGPGRARRAPTAPKVPLVRPAPRVRPASTGLQYVVIGEPAPANSAIAWGANCPAGTRVLGGGVSSTTPANVEIRDVRARVHRPDLGYGMGCRDQEQGEHRVDRLRLGRLRAGLTDLGRRRTSTPPDRGAGGSLSRKSKRRRTCRGSAALRRGQIDRMRELNLVRAGRLEWLDRPDPSLQNATDALVRPFWCTGFTHDFSWIDIPSSIETATQARARRRPNGARALLRRPRLPICGSSSLIGGEGRDARRIAGHIASRHAEGGVAEPHVSPGECGGVRLNPREATALSFAQVRSTSNVVPNRTATRRACVPRWRVRRKA